MKKLCDELDQPHICAHCSDRDCPQLTPLRANYAVLSNWVWADYPGNGAGGGMEEARKSGLF